MSFNNSRPFSAKGIRTYNLNKNNLYDINPLGIDSLKNLNVEKLEEDIAKEIKMKKVSEQRENCEIKRICNESAEIKELRNRINMAKLNQERSMQIYERQNRQLSQLNADAETDEQMLKRLEEEKKTEIQNEAKRKSELLNSKYVIYNKIVGSSKTNARSRNTKG